MDGIVMVQNICAAAAALLVKTTALRGLGRRRSGGPRLSVEGDLDHEESRGDDELPHERAHGGVIPADNTATCSASTQARAARARAGRSERPL